MELGSFFRKVINRLNKLITPQFYRPKLWKIKESDRILIISPHQDDESLGCGGLLLKYGKQCDVVLLTDGRYGIVDNTYDADMKIKIRNEEFESAMGRVNVNSYAMLGIEDSKLHLNYKAFKQLRSYIKKGHYDYILIPNPLDLHPDHYVVYKFMRRLRRFSLSCKKPKLMCYEVWGAIPRISHYIDISNVVEDKRLLIELYKSQTAQKDFASRILGLNCYRAMIGNFEYSECYKLLD